MDEQRALQVLQELIEQGRVADPQSARGKLLHAATHLFRSHGFERTTVRELASTMGIQSGSLFHHYKSKDEILRAVMEQALIYHLALMQASLEGIDDVRQRVLALIRCELHSILGNSGEAMAVLVYEWRSLSEEGRVQVLALRDQYEQQWLAVLAQAQAAGLLKGDLFIARRFLTGALSWTSTWFHPHGSLSLDQLAEEALKLVLKDG
ncbi:TetR/AcrR family transcriptional regulator [Pseudomonas sp. R5(2019)]|uniref:TetR/AcrR family transcriptional regulator n=1 Tax=Pseudomonas sp. R5(2019) TaxID=2697566 RepID=UPI0014135CC9|nr:TetR family transcriptional regulator [Pseudomonas sp. R5(2019)]